MNNRNRRDPFQVDASLALKTVIANEQEHDRLFEKPLWNEDFHKYGSKLLSIVLGLAFIPALQISSKPVQ